MMSAFNPRRIAFSLACHVVLAAALLVFANGDARSQTASPPSREGLVVPPGSAPRYAGQQGRDQDYTEVLATGGQTGGSLGMVRQTVAPKSGPPLHRQDHEDEFYYVVSGDFDFQVGDRRVRVPAQSFVFIPRGVVHTFMNAGAEPGVLVIGVTPGGFEMMFVERQGVDVDTNRTIMERHNMAIVGPPLR
jgi:mannose-6-phosphate isomerase-like protein (cupin superfamily)